jgi:hypothetical protein
MSINSNNKIESGYAKTFRNPKVFLGLCDANSILYLSGIQLDARANPEHLACSKPFFTSITLPPRFHSSSEKLRWFTNSGHTTHSLARIDMSHLEK